MSIDSMDGRQSRAAAPPKPVGVRLLYTSYNLIGSSVPGCPLTDMAACRPLDEPTQGISGSGLAENRRSNMNTITHKPHHQCQGIYPDQISNRHSRGPRPPRTSRRARQPNESVNRRTNRPLRRLSGHTDLWAWESNTFDSRRLHVGQQAFHAHPQHIRKNMFMRGRARAVVAGLLLSADDTAQESSHPRP